MNKKVLILSGSPRKDGNSDRLCNEFAKGAAEAGHQVEKIRVAEKKIGYCRACYACKETGIRAIQDDMAEVLQKMTVADGDAPAYQETLALAAEDFSFYQRETAGVFFFLGVGDTAELHAPTFDFDDETILPKGVEFLRKLLMMD